MTWICSLCKAEKETNGKTKHPPRGWKTHNDLTHCDKCWAGAWGLRAIAMPVVEPLSGTWADFNKALELMWRLTTQASNWMITELYARDVRRTEAEEKMPSMPRTYLYPEARQLFPALPPNSVASLEQAVTLNYRSKRHEIIWKRAAVLPTVRYPCPFPVHNQSWKVRFDSGRRPIVSVLIGKARWEFRLRGGPRYQRHLTQFGLLVAGSAKRGELSLFRNHDGEVICKIVAWLPRLTSKEALVGTLSVRSSAEALLVVVDANNQPLWTYNADHVRRWSAEHSRLILRLAQDQKAEMRPEVPFAARRQAAVTKYRNRMSSATHEITASLASFAARRKCAVVRYDDSEHRFCPQFPWLQLREKLKYKLAELGIALEHEMGAPESRPLVTEEPERMSIEFGATDRPSTITGRDA